MFGGVWFRGCVSQFEHLRKEHTFSRWRRPRWAVEGVAPVPEADAHAPATAAAAAHNVQAPLPTPLSPPTMATDRLCVLARQLGVDGPGAWRGCAHGIRARASSGAPARAPEAVRLGAATGWRQLPRQARPRCVAAPGPGRAPRPIPTLLPPAPPAQAAPTAATSSSSTSYPGFPDADTMAVFPPAVHDVFRLDDLLTPDERALRAKVRAFMVWEGREGGGR